MKVIFMGTPEFAVSTLDALVKNGQEIIAVITAPDRPAGRGRKIKLSAVKEYAVEHSITVLQPTNLKNPEFLTQLQNLNAEVQVVVAFRMLPRLVWNMPPKGTINLHGSLLPNYRGAAPINWAIINGEKETGVTTFFINEKIDTGDILMQEKCSIGENTNCGELHDTLMSIGASLVVKTLNSLESVDVKARSQNLLIKGESELKDAPKIYRDDCKLDWSLGARIIHNKIRGLSPFPGAWTSLTNKNGQSKTLKVFASRIKSGKSSKKPGELKIDENGALMIASQDNWIYIDELQLEGKKRMKSSDFVKGIDISQYSIEA